MCQAPPGAPRPRTIYLVKRLEARIRLHLEAAVTDLGLTPGQYTTLSVVAAGPQSSADLARRVGITPQSMSELTAGLERLGLIARTPRADNRRIADVALTAAGKGLLDRAEQRVDGVERDLFAALPSGGEVTLRTLLAKLI